MKMFMNLLRSGNRKQTLLDLNHKIRKFGHIKDVRANKISKGKNGSFANGVGQKVQ